MPTWEEKEHDEELELVSDLGNVNILCDGMSAISI